MNDGTTQTYNDGQQLLRNPDGSFVPAPKGAIKSAGGFYVDTTSGQRYGAPAGGIQLPSVDGLPNLGGGSNIGLSTSLPAINEEDIKSQVEKELGPSKDVLQRSFDQRIQQAVGLSEQEKRALEGKMGTGRRFSSSAEAFIKYVDSENKKQIASLELQRDEALANQDIKMAQLVQDRIQKARDNQQQDLENIFKMVELQEKQEARSLEARKKEIQASRENAISGVAMQLQERGEEISPVYIQNLVNYDDKGQQIGDITLEEVTKVVETFKNDRKEIDKNLVDLAKTPGVPMDVIEKASKARNLGEFFSLAGEYMQSGAGIVGEYLFYKRDAVAKGLVPVSFDEYQNEDANRKRTVINMNSGGLTSRENATFLSVTTKYQADAVINAAIKAGQVNAIADNIIANPKSATNQLASLYIYVKNLDPDSAVREGELSLANQTQSYLQKYKNSLTRLSEGRVISPEAATELAKATKTLVATWQNTAEKKTKLYKAQAKNSSPNVGNAFDSYLVDSEIFGTTQDKIVEQEKSAADQLKEIGLKNPKKKEQIKALIKQIQPDLGRAYNNDEILQILGN